MHLIHKATARQADGLIVVSVTIVNKTAKDYDYPISSDFALNRFLFFTRKKLYSKALCILNKFKVKGEKL